MKNGEKEPAGQELNITITLNATGPVLHPLLETLPGLSFTNIATFKLESTYHSDLYSHMFYNIFKLGRPGEESLGTPKVTISEQKLKITQLDCKLLQDKMKKRVALNCINFKEFSDMKRVRLVKENGMVGFKPIGFNINCGFSGHVPKKALIFAYSAENLPTKFINAQLTFAGQNGVIMQSIDDLIIASRLNGLDLSVNDQFNSYPVMTSFSNTKIVPGQCGHVLYLEYGNNLPIITNSTKPITASSKIDGLSADYKITVDGMFDSDFTDLDMDKEYHIQLFVYHLNDTEVIYSENSITKNVLGFSDVDLASAIHETDKAIDGNELTVNIEDNTNITGGSRMVHKIKRKAPVQPSAPSVPSTQTTGFMNDYILKSR